MDFSAAQAQHEMAETAQGAGHVAREVAVILPAEPTAAKAARTWVRETFPDLGESVLNDVELIASELVANAVKYGEPDIELRLRRTPLTIAVAVLDHGAHVPSPTLTDADPSTTGHRGLLLVDSLANAWGVEPLDDSAGKSVWATLS